MNINWDEVSKFVGFGQRAALKVSKKTAPVKSDRKKAERRSMTDHTLYFLALIPLVEQLERTHTGRLPREFAVTACKLLGIPVTFHNKQTVTYWTKHVEKLIEKLDAANLRVNLEKK